MHDLLSKFTEKTTRDELGLGTIRDAFADRLFPGTGVPQTRARYFFFIPWLYKELERKRVPASEIERRARGLELNLIDVLAAADEQGTIGVRSRRSLQRLPSNIYWAGLRRLGILSVACTQDDFHRRFDSFTTARALKSDDGEVVSAAVRSWHPKLPSAPATFPSTATFALTREEAAFLVDRVTLSADRSFFAWWLTNGFIGMDATFAWDAVAAVEMPSHLRRELEHARNFSDVMHGASIAYNILLRRARKQDVDDLLPLFDAWHDGITIRLKQFNGWHLDDFWRCVADADGPVGASTRMFVEAWVRLTTGASNAESLRESRDAKALIEHREAMLKRGLARFTNARALELWGGASGLDQMDFRWSSAKIIGRDIAAALGVTVNS